MLTIGILIAVGVLVGVAGAACQEYLATAQAANEAATSRHVAVRRIDL